MTEERETETKTDGEVASVPEKTFMSNRRQRRWFIVFFAPLFLSVAVFGLDRAMRQGEVLRGVMLGSRPLAGLRIAELRKELRDLANQLQGSPLEIVIRERRVSVTPEELDYVIDVEATAGAALVAGRGGGWFGQFRWWLGRWFNPAQITVVARLERDALPAKYRAWAKEAIDDPPFEGAVVVRSGQVNGVMPRSGHVIDGERATELISQALGTEQGRRVVLPLVVSPPLRDEATTKKAVIVAEQLLAGPIILSGEVESEPDTEKKPKNSRAAKTKKRAEGDDEEGLPSKTVRIAFSVSVLAQALRSRPVDGESPALSMYFDPQALDAELERARAEFERAPRDAKFVVEKRDELRLIPGRVGTVVDPQRVAEALVKAGQSPEREGEFPVSPGAPPSLSTEEAQSLKITSRVAKFTTFHPCCRPRVKNIHRIADMINGVIIKPNERFSVNEHIGPRTAAKGFVPAPTIVYGDMKDTVGGGISQFATTLFNAAFYGGYDIVERAPHSYYFPRYPMGHEATLSYKKPDLVIRNDSEAGLLIHCEYGPTYITVKMFGDNGGRKVKRKVSKLRDIVDPPIEYEANEELDPEEEKVLEKGQSGWTVLVARILRYADGREVKQQRKVIYKPRTRRLLVHPCKIPEGEDGHTGEACPEPEEEETEEGAADEEAKAGAASETATESADN